jgi:methionine--tRNA ligase beta chain
VAKEPKQKQQ